MKNLISMKIWAKLIPFTFSIFLILPRGMAQRVGFSTEHWVNTQTAHFYILHSAGHQDLGLYYAKIAEEAYNNLATIFPNPPSRITLVLNDSVDQSNGYATVFPYPLIMVYPVQIGNEETLSEAGEWARELVTHELTHIMQLYPYSGFYNFLRPVLGSIVSPNLLMPSWWKEGMAVEMETQFSNQGRTRSYMQNGQIRILAYEDKLKNFTLAEANETLHTWPYGSRPYFLGSLLMSEVAHDASLKSIGDMTDEQGGRVPFAINGPLQKSIGKSFDSEYDSMMANLQNDALTQIQTLQKNPLSELTTIDETLLTSRNPRFHEPTQTLALIGTNKKGTRIRFYKFDQTLNKWIITEKIKTISGDFGSFEFHPKQNLLFFSKYSLVNSKQNFSDIYKYDLETSKQTKLSTGLRAREIKISDSGLRIAFITTENGLTFLKIKDLANDDINTLIQTNYDSRITSCLFLNDNELLYVEQNKLGYKDLYHFNISQNQKTPIDSGHFQPNFLKMKDNHLYFVSAHNGVYNIYKSDLDLNKKMLHHIVPISHVVGGSQSFDLLNSSFPKNVVVTQVGSSGFKVQTTNERSDLTSLPEVTPEIRTRYSYVEKPLAETPSASEDYSALGYVAPRYWIPFISSNSNNKGTLLSATTSGQDPLNIHNYQLGFSYDTYLKKASYLLDYVNSAFNWPVEISAAKSDISFGTDLYTIEKESYSFGVRPDMFSIDEDLQANLGLIYKKTNDGFFKTEHAGGYAQLAYLGYEQKVYQYYPMSGWGALLRYENLKSTQSHPLDLFKDYSQALGSFVGYFSRWLPEDHAMQLKLNGLYTIENVSNRFGTSNNTHPITFNSLLPDFLIRGYATGQFYGKRLLTGNYEYRFPVVDLNSGAGTTPFFIKSITAAAVADGLAVDGYAEDKNQIPTKQKLSKQFFSAGIEARMGLTLGYLIPIEMTFGFYRPFEKEYAKSPQTAISLQIGGL